jgi:20S proteasome alpha/beta subunit
MVPSAPIGNNNSKPLSAVFSLWSTTNRFRYWVSLNSSRPSNLAVRHGDCLSAPLDEVWVQYDDAGRYGTHLPYPRPRQAPVTIAVGMVCTDGVLVCADTRQTVLGECVWEDTKMAKMVVPNFGDVVMAGCGNTSYIYMAFENIERALKQASNASRDFGEVLQKAILNIHRHIKACSDPRQPLPWVELIIGAQKEPGSATLWHIENTGAVSPVIDKVFMGTGRPIAVAFARIVLTERLPLELARVAAFFFMYQAKQSGYGTGGDTQICYLPRQKSISVWDDKEIAEGVEHVMRLFLLDTRNIGMPEQRFDEKVRDAFQQILAIRRSVLRKGPPSGES